MRILHTSDWHLGRSLYGRKRYQEFTQFTDWLLNIITERNIQAVLVAGDIFDTSTPSNRAQEIYYSFLHGLSSTGCRHVIIVGGNHDSPTFLNAPRELLRAMNVHVVGSATPNHGDEVLLLQGPEGPEAIVCAIPYLRDREVRSAEAGESFEEKGEKLAAGVAAHYDEVCALAQSKREECLESHGRSLPLIATGHLFTMGGKTSDDDGVRELYVGSLAHINPAAFPPAIDYLALGHLHVPQRVAKKEHLRYSGSPLPMGFGEATQEKQVLVVEFTGNTPLVEEVTVPRFQELVSIKGDLPHIEEQLAATKERSPDAWVEVEYTGKEVVVNLRDIIEEKVQDTPLEVLRIRNARMVERVMGQITDETLDDLDVHQVFQRCLEAFEIPDEERPELVASYKEVVQSLHEADPNAQ